jgi:Outer membrane protein beta-barrel domain
MKQNRVVLSLALLCASLCWPCVARAQNPTAIQRMQLSAFAGASGVFTGLAGGKNVSFTAGTDLALPPFHGLRPVAEIRGTYPIDDGTISSQRSIMGGLRVDYPIGHRIHPYGDFLFGRGQSNYGAGYFFGNFEYVLTTNYVYSPGGGFDYDLGDHFGVKVDAQYQRWTSAPTASGTIWSTVVTAGLVYRFNFNHHDIR